MLFKEVCFFFGSDAEYQKDILIAYLDNMGFEGVNEEDKQISGFISDEKYSDKIMQDITNAMKDMNVELIWTVKDVPDQNWNAIWERSLEPVLIDDMCAIRAPFHPEFTDFKYQITIEPKMSFGTGHHQTTQLMIKQMFEVDFKQKNVLDMGCGTGVLGILARMMGSSEVTMIDIDEWAFNNANENIMLNNINDIRVIHGGKEVIPLENFDIILANINKNILKDQADVYAGCLSSGGMLMISGFLKTDTAELKKIFNSFGFNKNILRSLDQWTMMMFDRN
ncbi:MAG: 50S ribosomal protein L11 methyltransferase [Bacteroidales bacterium]|nr:50S ribosomal protein L11 methyltransferase [Bacteroidales bacterium]